jgi:predicted Zn finger-like uncharacterized protein
VLTQCPNCQTVFRVTSVILRAAHGQVRCGRCNTQFDAIGKLIDGEEGTGTAQSASSGDSNEATATTTELVPEQLTHEEITMEGNRIEISGVYRSVPETETTHTETIIEEFNTSDEDWPDPAADEETTQSAESIASALAELESDNLASDAASLAEEKEQASIAASSQFEDTKKDIDESEQMRRRAREFAAPDMAALNETEHFAVPRRKPQWPWTLATVLLLVGLAAQSIHHERATLVRHPSFGPLLTKVYGALHLPLQPQWDMGAYSVKQWGIVSDPAVPGTLRVRASVTNNAAFAQPYPLLKLTLEDRFGVSVGTREFSPQDYLQSSARAARLLDAGEAANADISIVDPGDEAIGFHLDVCINLDNALRCSI